MGACLLLSNQSVCELAYLTLALSAELKTYLPIARQGTVRNELHFSSFSSASICMLGSSEDVQTVENEWNKYFTFLNV